MTTKQAKDILHNPDIIFVRVALSFVNLTDKELTTLVLRHLRGHTQAETGKELMVSEFKRQGKEYNGIDEYDVTYIQKIEKNALLKCCEVWEKLSFVKFSVDKK